MFALFEYPQNFLRTGDHGGWQTGKLRDVNTVRLVGRTRDHFMQKDHVAFPFGDPHRMAGQRIEPGCQRCQFMEMGSEQGPAAVYLVQVFERRPGDGQAIEGRRAAPDLIQDNQ